MSDKIINEVKDYINNVIRPPREEFGGMPTCPFAGPELDSGRLMISVVIPDKVVPVDLRSVIVVIPDINKPEELTSTFVDPLFCTSRFPVPDDT